MTSRILLAAGVLLAGLCVGSAAQEPQRGASLIVTGGRVWTGDEGAPWAEAVAAEGGRIVAVGSREEVMRLATDATRIVDAGGGLITPGMFDSHIHLFGGGLNLDSVQLRDADTKEEFVRRIGEFAAARRPGEWVTGGDWDHTMWGGEPPRRDWIDSVTPNNPVWLRRLDGHMALANSAALALAGVDASATTPDGGEIDRDADGEPTGLLRDNAMGLVERVVPDVSPARMLEGLQAASDYVLERGITSVCHMGSMEELRTLRAARQQDALRIRVHAATPLSRWALLLADIERHGRGDEWLRVGGLKGFVDGSLGSHTAAFLQPFTDAPTERGLLVNSAEDLRAWTTAADAAGLQVMVHAIGDRAIRIQLDNFEAAERENGPRDRRFRIEHAQHIAPDDIPRFAELGVIASMQPYHCIDDGRWAEAVIGPERSMTTYAFRSLLDGGARLAFGSDWFVAPATPLEGIYAAVTRRTLDGAHPGGWVPEQKISVEEALRAYTVDSAYAAFAENEKGMLKAGMLADIVVVDRDLFEVAPEELDEAQVLYTIVDGEVVYEQTAD